MSETKWKEDFFHLKYSGLIGISNTKQSIIEDLIKQIHSIYKEWLQTKMKSSLFSVVLPTGSYLLKTMLCTSDLDLVFFLPFTLTFQIFTIEFLKELNRNLRNIQISHIRIREKAWIPLLRFRCSHVYEKIHLLVDCSLVQITNKNFFTSFPSKRQLLLHSKFNVKNSESLVILSSLRCLEAIVSLVDPYYLYLFRHTVQYIMLWAKTKNICSNSTGFPSSITYVLMFFPVWMKHYKSSASSFELLYRFFHFYFTWNFNKPIEAASLIEKLTKTYVPIFCSSNKQPFPSLPLPYSSALTVELPFLKYFNTAHNVVRGSLEIIKNEIAVAFHHLHCAHMHSITSQSLGTNLNQIFYERRNFFLFFEHFFVLESSFVKKNESEMLMFILELRYVMKKALIFFDSFFFVSQLEIYEYPITYDQKQYIF